MRRSNVLLIFLLGGCGAVAPQPEVYIDLEKVMASAPPERTPPRPQASPISLPAVAERSDQLTQVESISGSKGISDEELQARFKASQESALRELEIRLRKIYSNDLAQVEEEEHRRAIASASEMDQKLRDQLKTRFTQYADARAKILPRLAFLVGHPDPDPKSKESAPSPLAQKRIEEAKDLRMKLSEINLKYKSGTDAILSKTSNNQIKEAQMLQRRLEDLRAEGDRRAESEAAQEIQKLTIDLRRRLGGSEIASPSSSFSLKMPATPGVQAPAPMKLEINPSPPRSEILNNLKLEAEVWAKANGYALKWTNSKLPDRTEEFLKWRNSPLPGR